MSAKPAGRSWQGVDLFEHGSFVYLMGPDGKFLTLFPPVMAPDAMAEAIGGYLGCLIELRASARWILFAPEDTLSRTGPGPRGGAWQNA